MNAETNIYIFWRSEKAISRDYQR